MITARKHSRKRDAILACVRGTTCHPTAEWVYAQLKPEIPDLSLGTVYRNLAIFKQAHFVCTKCTGVYDVPQETLPVDFLRSAEALTRGEITSYQLSYYGICPKCKNSDKNDQNSKI